MQPAAILFGSIGTVAETSELQREAFNDAFAEAGLDWHWSPEDYTAMLETPGGLKRIESYNRERGARVDADAIHASKSARFQARMRDGIELRPGVREVIETARRAGTRLAFCTTTSRANVDAMLESTGLADAFDWIGDDGAVANSKPAPDVYHAALRALGVAANEAVAIEDSPENANAAAAAGLRVIAFPGARHAHRSFDAADRVDVLTPQALGLEEGNVAAE